MIQPTPFVVEVLQQPAATPDISVSTVINVLIMPFIAVGVTALGGLLVAGAILLYKRLREGAEDAGVSDERIRLKI